MVEFTMTDLVRRGRAPALRFLIQTIRGGGETVTYKQLSTYLNETLGLTNVTHHHVGDVVEAVINDLRQIEPSVPLINLMVMRGDTKEPGKGALAFLAARYDRAQPIDAADRVTLLRTALNEVGLYSDWPEMYRRAYGSELDNEAPLEDFEDDGQGDNPKRPRGGLPESDEHKRLKQYVCDHPHELQLKLRSPSAAVERPLLSGDRMDVYVIDGPRRIAVEVKSCKSGDADLERGIFQCVKYREVLKAQSRFEDVEGSCEAVLVSERTLPARLKAIAARLGVPLVVLCVNVPTRIARPLDAAS